MKIIQIVPILVVLIVSGCREQYDILPTNNDFETNVVLRDGVVQFSEDEEAVITDVDSTSITLLDHSFSQGLKEGDILVSGGFKDYPSGFLRRITKINSSNGEIKLQTVHASLDDAFSVLDFGAKVFGDDTLQLRDDKLTLELASRKVTLENLVEKDAADRIKFSILQALDLEALLRPEDVEFSLTASAIWRCDYDAIFSSSQQFLEFRFQNNEVSFSFEPKIKIGGQHFSFSDQHISFCDFFENNVSKPADYCDNNTLTLFGVKGPRIQVPNAPVNFQPFFRISFLLSAALQGSLGFKLSHTTNVPVADFSMRAGLTGVQLQAINGDEVVVHENDVILDVNGNIKAEGKFGFGFEAGLALYDQELLNANMGAEYYLKPSGIIKGGLSGSLTDYLNARATVSGDFAMSLDAKVDVVGKLSSDVINKLGFNPSDWIAMRRNMYSKTLLSYFNNCGNYKNYSFDVVYSNSTWVTTDCNEVGIEFRVEGAAAESRTYDLDIELPNDSFVYYNNLEYNRTYYLDYSGILEEGDELDIGIWSVDDACFIAERLKYIVPTCEGGEWITLRSASAGVGNVTIQRGNLAAGGDNGEWYDNNEEYGRKYGKLYSWGDLIYDGVERSQSFCPDGSVVPSLSNWKDLIIGTLDRRTGGAIRLVDKREIRSGVYAYKFKGAQLLKEKGEWSDFDEGTNKSWLEILPAGEKIQGDNAGGPAFQRLGTGTGFWTSTSISETEAYAVIFTSDLGDTFLIIPVTKDTKASCRCIKK